MLGLDWMTGRFRIITPNALQSRSIVHNRSIEIRGLMSFNGRCDVGTRGLTRRF